MASRARAAAAFDAELDDLLPEMRWRVWMGRVEAVIFAASAPVARETLAQVVGRRCNLDALIADIRAELANRPYELVAVAGGWSHRTRKQHAEVIRFAAGAANAAAQLSTLENLVLAAIAYFQPVTRAALCDMLGREISRDTIADLRTFGLVANGPRSPRAGAPSTYVTTPAFLSRFGFEGLQDLPDREAVETAGLAAVNSEPRMIDVFAPTINVEGSEE